MNQHQRPSDSGVAPTNALVLGGGGPVGASWMSTLLHELRVAGVPLAESDVVVGTSAGSVVGAWLTIQPEGLSGVPALMQERAAWHASNATSGRSDRSVFEKLGADAEKGTDHARQLGQAAIAAMPPISADQAEKLWAAMLPGGAWSRQLRTVSVNADTGEARVWSRRDDISLAVGVSCSTAAPGVAPPVKVDGSVWVDGGVRTATNADLVVEMSVDEDGDQGSRTAGPGRVLVVAPFATEDIAREQATLVERGYRVRVVTATPFYNAPTDLIDPRFIDIAATAGTSQARELAAELLTWWKG